MIIPSPLKAGDKVGLVAPARKVTIREIEPAIAVLRDWGLEPVIGKSIGAEYFQFGGDDNLRREDIQKMLDDNSIKAILFARGGYGTVRIVDDLDFRKFVKNPKWLCGFSDVTVIHSHLQTLYNCCSVHSIMAINMEMANFESLDSLHKILFGEKTVYQIPSHDMNRKGDSSGILCGGNLSLLYSLSGSTSDIDCIDKILLIEDTDEYLYHVDRMIMQLKRSGKLEHLAGLIVGHFNDMKDKDDANPFGKSAYEIIAEHVNDYDFPVCYSFPSGHHPDNRALIMGEKYSLKVSDSVDLRIETT